MASSLGESDELLMQETSTGNWMEGYRFSLSATDTDIKKMTDTLK